MAHVVRPALGGLLVGGIMSATFAGYGALLASRALGGNYAVVIGVVAGMLLGTPTQLFTVRVTLDRWALHSGVLSRRQSWPVRDIASIDVRRRHGMKTLVLTSRSGAKATLSVPRPMPLWTRGDNARAAEIIDWHTRHEARASAPLRLGVGEGLEDGDSPLQRGQVVGR